QSERRRVAAHYLCELAEQALLQGDLERALLLLRQARTHDAELPRASLLAARVTEASGDERGALTAYLGALEAAPSLALEIIRRLLALASQLGEEDIVAALTERLQKTGRVSQRQLAWLLATALPTLGRQQLPDLGDEKAAPVPESNALGALL